MKNPFLNLAAVAGGFIGLALADAACSQPYPQRPIRFVVQGVASSAPDIITRPIARRVSERIGQPVIVDNRPGAGGMIAAQIAVAAWPDGYTFLVASSGTISIAPFLTNKSPYDPTDDLAPVTILTVAPLVVTAHPSVPARSVKELIALAKSGSTRLQIGTPGVGTVQHLTVEMFNRAAGVSLGHVPYKGGGAAVIDALGGQIPLVITSIPAILPHVMASRLRALGITGVKRSPVIPEVVTFAESGLRGFDATTWYAVYAPRKTPAKIIERIFSEIREAAEAPDVKSMAAQQGVELQVTGALALDELQRADIAKWQKVIRESKIVLE